MNRDKANSSAMFGTLDPIGLANLVVVYIVWSTTYLAIRLAVQEGSGLPPFTMGFMRAALGGLILLAWGRWRGEKLRITRGEAFTLAGSGLLLWLGGNGLVTFAEQHAASGLAALLVAASPMWAAVIEAIVDRKLPSGTLALSLLAGFIGIAFLTAPELLQGVRVDVVSVAALIVAPMAWAGGSVLQARRPVDLSPRSSSAYQMAFGAIGFAVVVLLVGEPFPQPTTEALLAWAYLVIFGSLFAFTAYVTALRLLPTPVVMTYAYVNPVLAVLLGAWLLNEEITIWTLAGSVLVLLGVAGVFRARRQANRARATKS